ncbi:MAG: peptidyl-prolyl cis-trans isomerase [Acidobacteria bacterium]|nr:peptidyl-prolyl cis-trans isomerase [Acidobacteriota bacterium]
MFRYCRSLFILFVAAVLVSPAFAQETEEYVVDEVVAQINDGVLTLSRIKRESKLLVDAQVEQGRSREDAQREVDEKQGEMIANLINEELLMQRGKELGLEREVEAAVNQRFLEMMRQYDIKTLEGLFEEMRKTGVNPDDVRDVWRKQLTREMVIQQEVHRKIYWGSSSKDLKDYFEANKQKFTKPETVTLSELFLSFAGRSEASVREKAKELLTQLRGGADWEKILLENSDRPTAAQDKGKIGVQVVSDLNEKASAALKGINAGGYSEPIEADQVGISILRVDERSAASSESHFDENAIRMAIMSEKAEAEGKKYMSSLRQDAYIKINDSYRPIVAPILFAEERKERSGN